MENGAISSNFTTNTQEVKWRPVLYLNGQQIKYNPSHKFLGMTYDRQLTFGLHSSIVGSKMKQQAGTLRCLVSTYWGYEKSTLRPTYIATDRSIVENAAAAWLPWVSLSKMDNHEMCQRYTGKAIIVHVKMTPAEKTLAEAHLLTVTTRATQLSTIAMENSI